MQRWVASKKLPDTRKTFLALALTSIASIIHLMCLIAQFSSVIQSCLNLCNPMDCSTPGLPGHHQLDGYEFEQGLGVGFGQEVLACCSPWGCKESDMTELLN